MRDFFERLLGELPALLRSARRLTRSEADAEDLVQSTLARAIERRGDLRDQERLRAWLLQVQRSVLLNSARGKARHLEVLEGGGGLPGPEPSADLAEELERGQLSEELERALAGLPAEWREALLLREVEELSYEQIAEVQGCPVGTVRSRLSRARGAVLEALSDIERGHHARLQQRVVR